MNFWYRRNIDEDLRELERKFDGGDRQAGFRLARTYKRVGRNDDAMDVYDALWIPVELDLSFLVGIDPVAEVKINNYMTETIPIEGVYPPLISPEEFIREWMLAEHGSWEDAGMPDEGHVVNILDRGVPHARIEIESFSELGDLLYSLGSCTAGYCYTADGESDVQFPHLGLSVNLPRHYGELADAVGTKLRQLKDSFLAEG